MSDQLPDGCVYLGQNQRGKVIHTYNGWAIHRIDTGTDGYVAWLVDAEDLGVEASAHYPTRLQHFACAPASRGLPN